MFIAVLLTMAKKWKQPKCPSGDELINKMCYVHTIEYYSAIERNGILTQATVWMDLENIMLSETRQLQKDKRCMIPLI